MATTASIRVTRRPRAIDRPIPVIVKAVLTVSLFIALLLISHDLELRDDFNTHIDRDARYETTPTKERLGTQPIL